MRRTAYILPLLVCALVGTSVARQNPGNDPPAGVAKIGEGVFVLRHDIGAGEAATPNRDTRHTGWVVFEEFVLVIDAGEASSGESLLQAVRATTDRPIRYLLDTSEQPRASAFGGPEFRSEVADAATIGCRNAVFKLADRIKIGDGTQRVEILHLGAGRTPTDAVAYLPRQKILFAGNLAPNAATSGWTAAETSSWLDVLTQLAELDVESVVPGRGPLGGTEILTNQKRWLTELRRSVEAGLIEGKDPARITEGLDASWYETWTGRPAAKEMAAVRHVFDEMTGRIPARDLIEEIGLRPGPSPTRDTPGWKRPEKVVVYGDAETVARLVPVAPKVELVPVGSYEAAVAAVADADGMLGLCSAEIVRAGSKLRWIQVGSAGVERYVSIPELKGSDITLTNAQRLYGPEIAEHVFGMILALSRGLSFTIPRQSTGKWLRSELGGAVEFVELRGKTILVVGLGGIGTEVARRAHGFDMRVVATRRNVKDRPPFVLHVGPPDATRTLAAEADVVVNCTPLTPETRGMFDADFFEAMKPTAYFVNVGRGGSVVTDDLVSALESGAIAGACLDVTDPEPLPSDHPLWKLDNVVITPHVSARSDLASGRRFELYRENLRRFVAGEPLLSVVDKERGY